MKGGDKEGRNKFMKEEKKEVKSDEKKKKGRNEAGN